MNGSDERDRSIERLLRQASTAPPSSATDGCLDAETLAAWFDGGLAGAALEIAQTHVADCGRCQAMVAAVVRTTTALPTAEPPPRRWFAWLVPLTAAATAIALWVAVPRERAAPTPEPTSAVIESDQAKAPTASPPDQQAQPGRRPTQESLARSEATQKAEAGRDLRPLQAEARERKQSQSVDGIAPETPASPTVPAPVAAAPPPNLNETAAAVGSTQGRTADRAFALPAPQIVSPDPSVRWRLAGSSVERSANGGANWEAVFTGDGAALTTGTAPSASICWIVGRGGTVLRSTDGRRFSRVPFPESVDLSAVTATDGRSASVTTVDGRAFQTTDGGVTWAGR